MTHSSPRDRTHRTLCALLVLAGPLLAGLPQSGHAQSAASPPASATDELAARQAEVDALRLRSEQLQSVLAGDVCADPQQAQAVLQDGKPLSTPLTNTAAPPPASSGKPATEASHAGDAQAIARKELVDRLHKGVVLVLAEKDSGSGFFVTPSIVVTNSHVVATAKNGEVVVAGKGLNSPKIARVIASTNAKAQNGRDYAVLQVQDGSSSTVLPLALETSELTPVVAAGFPGLLLDTDMNFSALIRGDMKAMPELGMSQGAVMALQNRTQGLPVIVHSAPISGGNSGGPLVDGCGRVVGINTFINVSVEQASSAGFAQASSDLAAYLKGLGIQPQTTTNGCDAK